MVITLPTPELPTPENWREVLSAWADGLTGALLSVGIIVVGACIVWLIGRLIIRGIIRGISDGREWTESQARDVLTKVKLSESEEVSLDKQLADDRKRSRAKTIGLVLRATLNTAVLAIGTVMVLAELGMPVAPLLASAGIVGVAVGFGAQSLVKDLLSGLFMLIEDQYGVGDVVNTGEATGFVEAVGLRSTRLRDLDGTVWFVPNGEIRRVGNMTQLYSRVLIEVRFAYDVDVDAAREAMLDAAQMASEDPDLTDAIIGHAEVAGIESMDYNSVMLRLMMQTKPITQWSVMRAIRRHMRDLFMERGINLAAPENALIQQGNQLETPGGRPRRAPAKTRASTKPATKSTPPAGSKPAPKGKST